MPLRLRAVGRAACLGRRPPWPARARGEWSAVFLNLFHPVLQTWPRPSERLDSCGELLRTSAATGSRGQGGPPAHSPSVPLASCPRLHLSGPDLGAPEATWACCAGLAPSPSGWAARQPLVLSLEEGGPETGSGWGLPMRGARWNLLLCLMLFTCILGVVHLRRKPSVHPVLSGPPSPMASPVALVL